MLLHRGGDVLQMRGGVMLHNRKGCAAAQTREHESMPLHRLGNMLQHREENVLLQRRGRAAQKRICAAQGEGT